MIEALPAEVRQVLFAATLGASADTETLSHLLKIDGPAIDEALQAAQATGLITETARSCHWSGDCCCG